MNNEQSVKIYNMVATSREWKMDRRKGREGREGTGIKEGEGEDVEQQGVGKGGKEGEGRDGNKGRGGRGWGPLRGKRVEWGGEEGK